MIDGREAEVNAGIVGSKNRRAGAIPWPQNETYGRWNGKVSITTRKLVPSPIESPKAIKMLGPRRGHEQKSGSEVDLNARPSLGGKLGEIGGFSAAIPFILSCF